MENVAGEQGLSLQQLFPYKSSDHYKISISLDRALKLGHFDIFDMLFPFLAFVQ